MRRCAVRCVCVCFALSNTFRTNLGIPSSFLVVGFCALNSKDPIDQHRDRTEASKFAAEWCHMTRDAGISSFQRDHRCIQHPPRPHLAISDNSIHLG